jgi:hypothetical protein
MRCVYLGWLRGIEAVYDASVAAGDEVPVNVHGGLDAPAAELLLDGYGACTLA